MLLANASDAWATGPDRYYEPLDKLSRSSLLASRNKESVASSELIFPFNPGEYATRMNSIAGLSFDLPSDAHLKKLTGTYADKMLDALGLYAELDSFVSAAFREKGVSSHFQMLAPMLSGMNSQYSDGTGKVGVWQLDVVTAARYGLVVSATRDDRKDVFLSTRAAAAYLSDLQNRFRSPQAVLWAYISSPAEVVRIFGRAGSADLTKARAFAPVYLQEAHAVYASWVFIWTFMDHENVPVFSPRVYAAGDRVGVPAKTHLGQIAEVLNIPRNVLVELNPALRKSIALPNEFVYLPVGYSEQYKGLAQTISAYKDSLFFAPETVKPGLPSDIAKAPQTTLNTTVKKYHKVRSGESLSVIAQKYRVSVSSLKKWNNLRSNMIKPGQKLVVQVSVQKVVSAKEDQTVRENVKIEDRELPDSPLPAEEVKPEPKPPVEQKPENKPELKPQPKPEPKPQPKQAWTYYTVKSGDTLYSLGKKYKVPYTKIKEWNGLRSDNLQIGQKLKIKR